MFLGLTLEQWVSGATVVGVILALLTLAWQIKGQRNQLDESKKTRSAQVGHDYNNRLLDERFRVISRIMALSEMNSKPIQIGLKFDTDVNNLHLNEFDLDNYLSELETLSLFINDGVIGKKYAYELFGGQIHNVFTNNDVSNYIKNSIKSQPDLWDQLNKAHDTLEEYRKNKYKKP